MARFFKESFWVSLFRAGRWLHPLGSRSRKSWEDKRAADGPGVVLEPGPVNHRKPLSPLAWLLPSPPRVSLWRLSSFPSPPHLLVFLLPPSPPLPSPRVYPSPPHLPSPPIPYLPPPPLPWRHRAPCCPPSRPQSWTSGSKVRASGHPVAA
jgi:hypothetical protein